MKSGLGEWASWLCLRRRCRTWSTRPPGGSNASIVRVVSAKQIEFRPRRVLLASAAVLLALTVWALTVGSSIPDEFIYDDGEEVTGDLALYDRIVDRVNAGENYYTVAVDEQLAGNYPTSPPTAIRLPTMTYLMVAFGSWTPNLMRILLIGAAILMMVRFEKFAPSKIEWWAAVLLGAAAIGLYAHPLAAQLHEAWAVILMMWAALMHRPDRYWPSVILGFAAVCFRELAGPFLVIMGLLAWRRDRRESLTWFASALIFLAGYAVHWVLASNATAASVDRPSQGWISWGGWPHVVDTFKFSSIVRTLPLWVSAILVMLALLGWLALRNAYATTALTVTLGFMALFMVAGRPNTAYWGHLYVAFLLPGLAFAPRAALMLVRGLPRDREKAGPN